MLFKTLFKSAPSGDTSTPTKKKSTRLTHNVYVVELSSRVWSDSKKFREANRHYKGTMGCLYVGMTAHSPNERFKKHLTGHRNKKGYKVSSKFVEKYGIYLRPTLYNKFNPLTREDAAILERQLAESLKKRGYAVWWN
jgi:hypothetical protein